VIEQLVLSAPNQNGRKTDSGSSIKLAAPLTVEREIIGIRPSSSHTDRRSKPDLNRPDGSAEVLILARGYKFDWQPTYFFESRARLRPAVIDVTTYHDPAAKFEEAGRRSVRSSPPVLARHTS
jgi:hypothetical protein